MDTNETGTQLVTILMSNPLPELRRISYGIHGQHLVPPPLIRCAPWDVLPIYPGIRELYLTQEWDWPRGITSLYAPTFEKLSKLLYEMQESFSTHSIAAQTSKTSMRKTFSNLLPGSADRSRVAWNMGQLRVYRLAQQCWVASFERMQR